MRDNGRNEIPLLSPLCRGFSDLRRKWSQWPTLLLSGKRVSISPLTQVHLSSISVPSKTFLRDDDVADGWYCDAPTTRGRAEYMSSYPALLIANYFIDAALKDGQPISHLKLQKLLYFAHGFALAAEDMPLLDETVEAWRYGPVVPSVYQQFKANGSAPIEKLVSGYEFSSLEEDSSVSELLEFVWSSLKGFTPYQLSEMTHLPGAPWELARKEDQRNTPNALIRNELIKTYFIQHYRKDSSL